jgi:hypothetical protein
MYSINSDGKFVVLLCMLPYLPTVVDAASSSSVTLQLGMLKLFDLLVLVTPKLSHLVILCKL